MSQILKTHVVEQSGVQLSSTGYADIDDVSDGGPGWDFVQATLNSGGVMIRCQQIGPNKVRIRCLKEVNGDILPATDVTVTFAFHYTP